MEGRVLCMETGGVGEVTNFKAGGQHVQSPGGWRRCGVFVNRKQLSGQEPDRVPWQA